MSDWIEDFVNYTSQLPSPEIFRRWAGITAISGALGRKVWMETAHSILYPNLFTLLVGPPATGKTQAITPVKQLWYATKEIHISPDDMTKASFLDALKKSEKKILLSEDLQALTNQIMLDYHAMSICVGEFGVFMSQHDLNYISVLNDIYDSPPVYRESRRSQDSENDIIAPQVTILAGTQPGFLGSLLPEVAWNMGFTSRLIMVYSGDVQTVELFNSSRPNRHLYTSLLRELTQIAKMVGQIHWTPEAQEAIRSWNAAGCPPVPTHSKLEHYRGRRIINLLKLCAVSAISRSKELLVELEDFSRAKSWLLDAEISMPDIFRQMAGRSDTQVINELHFYAWAEFAKTKKPIHESLLINFLSTQVPAEKISKILEMCDKAKILVRQAGTQLFVPQPKHKHGME